MSNDISKHTTWKEIREISIHYKGLNWKYNRCNGLTRMQQWDLAIPSWLSTEMLALGMRNLNKNTRFENDDGFIVVHSYDDAFAVLRNADDLGGETFTRASRFLWQPLLMLQKQHTQSHKKIPNIYEFYIRHHPTNCICLVTKHVRETIAKKKISIVWEETIKMSEGPSLR